MGFRLAVEATDPGCAARAGVIETAHGPVETPVFMPVGTQGAIRGLAAPMLHDTPTSIILANTYHLSQRPGERIVEKHGGAISVTANDDGVGSTFSFSIAKPEGTPFALPVAS